MKPPNAKIGHVGSVPISKKKKARQGEGGGGGGGGGGVRKSGELGVTTKSKLTLFVDWTGFREVGRPRGSVGRLKKKETQKKPEGKKKK